MTKEAFTPGPWEAAATGSQPGAYSIVGDGRQLVALVFGETREAQRANAALAAAALDLLDIARQHAKAIEYYRNIDRRNGDDEGARLKTITLAVVDAVIAKAEGRP